MELVQAIGAVDPVSATLVRAGVFGVHVERKARRQPGKMKSKCVGARILQQLPKRSSYLNPRTGQENGDTPADATIGLQVVVAGADGGHVGHIVEVGLGVGGESAAQH